MRDDLKTKILDIAMNLNRIGNWAADGFEEKKDRIDTFLGNTSGYIESLNVKDIPLPVKDTYLDFLKDYSKLEKEGRTGPKNPLFWAEDMMTWGNILTARTSLI